MGRVGGGKTTLLNLIPRLYDPPPGTVFLDGKDVREIPLPRLRHAIGAVPQEAFLFSLSIEENVAAGTVGPAPDGLVESCTSVANVDGDIAGLADGYETLLGEKGVNLSGGQKQRIAIARALAGRPEVLLLDDCTSSLDARNEDRLWAGVQEHCPGVTIFCVSHRPSTIRRADVILVMDRGRLVDSGTHAELSRRCKEYGEFLHAEERRQHLAEELGDAE